MLALALLVPQWTERLRSHCRWVLVVRGGQGFVAKGTEGPETAVSAPAQPVEVPDEREQRGEDALLTRDSFSFSDSRCGVRQGYSVSLNSFQNTNVINVHCKNSERWRDLGRPSRAER